MMTNKTAVRYLISLLCVFMLNVSIAAERRWTDQEAGILLQQLRKERSRSNIDTIIAIGRDGPVAELLQNEVFAALSDTGPSDLADNFAKEILESESASTTLKYGALGYLLNKPQAWMSAFATQYMQSAQSIRLRAAACTLGARLNLPSTNVVAQEIIADDSAPEWRTMALYCLAESVPPEALRDAANNSGLSDFEIYNAMSYAGFKLAESNVKEELLLAWLDTNHPILVQQALHYVLATNRVTTLERIDAVLPGDARPNGEAPLKEKWRIRIRRIGYRVLGQTDALTISPLLPTAY